MIILRSFIQKIMLFILCISYLHIGINLPYAEGKLMQLCDAFSELILNLIKNIVSS